MKCSYIGIVWLLLIWLVNAQNLTNILTKTKRNLSKDLQSYGEHSFILPLASNPKIYYEPKPTNSYYQARPLAVVELSQPVKVIEPKVAAEHVLYEFQQTPTDSISNVHVKQLFEPDLKPPPLSSNYSPPSVITSETIVAPVQHGPFVQNHVQPFNIKQHPLYNIQPTIYEPKKYVYGKIIVDSTLPQPNPFVQTPTFHSNQQFVPQIQDVQLTNGKPIISYVNHFPRNNPHITEQPPPITQPKFRPPPKNQYQPIDTPIHVQKFHTQKPKPIPSVKPVVENVEVEEDAEDKSEYEEEDNDDPETPFEKYFDDEEEHNRDHENFEDDDEELDEDNKRGSSRYISKTEYYPKKHRKSKKPKNSSGKYGFPDEKYFTNDKYKYKYKHAKKTKYPRSELDGRFSEPIPITHKKKIVKEKWFLSKSLGDTFDKE